MKTDRPVNLNIFTIRFPLAAIVSITHRITGAILFVGIAFGLYALQLALSSPQGFDAAVEVSRSGFGAVVLLGLLLAVVFHLVAGIKHLLLDFHLGDSLEAAQNGAIAVIILTLVITGVLGVMLW